MDPLFRSTTGPLTVCLEKPERPGSHAISCQDVDTHVPVQGVVRLLGDQGGLVDNHLPYGYYLLEHLGLEGGSPRPASIMETMNYVIKTNHQCEALVEEACGGIP